MKFDIIVADCPWAFNDRLEMSSVKRGAKANYETLDIDAIKKLKVNEVAKDDSLLSLWVPSSLLQEGLDTMSAWGFRQTQTHIWVKIKINPLHSAFKELRKLAKGVNLFAILNSKEVLLLIKKELERVDLNKVLAFGMGHAFRQTHEICLIGVRGKIYDKRENKSQRSVHFDTNKKHSAKPEILQDRLELMFPNTAKLEMFARRARPDWTCVGLECPGTIGEDIRDTIDRLIKLP